MARNTQKEIDNAKRNAQIITLRYLGKSFEQIAREMGFNDRGNAYRAYKKAMENNVIEAPEEIRAIEIQRLDRMTETLMEQLENGNFKIIPYLLHVMDRRAKLLGLDTPIRIQQEITTWEGGDSIDRAVKELTDLLGKNNTSSQSALDVGENTSSA